MKQLQAPRLSDLEVVILQMLVMDPEMYGLDMVRKSNGTLKRGTIYVTLQRMEEKGLVSSEREKISTSPTIPRRLYKPTPAGVHSLEAVEKFTQLMNSKPVPA